MIVEVFGTIVGIFLFLYVWLRWNYSYWKNAGVVSLKPTVIFGNHLDVFLMRKAIAMFYDDIYRNYPDEPAVGLYAMRQPELLIRDADLAKTVLIKEFHSFHDNKEYVDEKIDPILGKNPFFSRGERWKKARSIHTPALTTVKLKAMVPNMVSVARDMVEFLDKNQDVVLDAKYFAGQYTTDVVASSIFGVTTNSFKDPDATFRKMTNRIFTQGEMRSAIFVTLVTLCPSILSLIRMKFLPDDLYAFFGNVIKQAYDHRVKTGEQRPDFLQQLINENSKSDKPVYTEDEITAYTMTFLFDGYETSSIAIAYILYCLTGNMDVQEKLRQEINEAFPDIEKVDFEKLSNLPYLDAVVNETLRIFPPGTSLTRLCTKDITLEKNGKSYPIKKGQCVTVPIYSMHKDSKYFEDPDLFKPSRFLDKSGNVEAFFPFGGGPRACLGQRFALTQTKLCIATLVSKYQILPKTYPLPKLEWNESSGIFLLPKGGMWAKFRRLEHTVV